MLRHWKPALRTLRFRWACWNALVVIITASVTMIGLRQGVQWALLHELDQILIEDLAEIELSFGHLDGSDWQDVIETLNRKAVGHQRHGWFVEFLGEGNQQIWSSVDAPDWLDQAAPSTAGRPVSRGLMRLVYRPIRSTSTPIRSIRVGASLNLLRQEMSRIDRLVLIASGIVLLVAPPVGYWLARRAARTVGQIIHAAGRLRPSHLDERLPVRGTGDELDTLALTVNRLLDRIAVYLQLKRDFLANAAHELRTPLAAIRSSVEVTLSGQRSPDEYEDLLVDLIDQCSTLETLVNQLLLLSETESDQLSDRGEPVRLDGLVEKSAGMFQGVAESRGITLKLTRIDPVFVLGHRSHLRQVVNNLLDNAIKYSSSGGRVQISLQRQDSEGVARLTIRDNGQGISDEDLPHVFDRFFRADRSRSRTAATPGNGLGLSICQAVVQAHRGSIHCSSQLGQGTVLQVTLPLSSPPQGREFSGTMAGELDSGSRSKEAPPATAATHEKPG